MKIPFVDWGASYAKQKGQLDSLWNDINSRGQLLLRDEVEDFEKSLARIAGAKHAVGVNSGSDALLLALESIGIGKGDEVITVSHTFMATLQAIERVGAIPVFVDVGQDELMDVTKIEEAITDKTKAILPVHLTGKVCDMETINAIAELHGLHVVEDSAQAFGASQLTGDVACYSFYPFKILGCAGDGGGIVTNNDDIARKLRLLRNHGNVSQTGMDVGEKGEVRRGWNSRLDNLQAGILNVRIGDIDAVQSRRNEIASMYDTQLAGLPITLPTPQKGRVYQEYVVQVDDRTAFVKFLNSHEVEVLPNIKQIQAGLKPNHLVWCDDELPMTSHFTNHNVRLPIWPTLTDEQVQYVCDTIKQYFQNV